MLIKDINFFDRYHETQRREKNVSKTTTVRVASLAVILVATAMSFSVLQFMTADVQGEIDSINAYITSPEVAAQLEDLNEKVKIFDNANSYYMGIKSAADKIETNVMPDQELVALFTGLLPQGVQITSFSYSNGNVSLACKSDSENKLANYVHALKAQDMIHGVAYSGYSKAETEYTTSLQIILKPAGGEENAINE